MVLVVEPNAGPQRKVDAGENEVSIQVQSCTVLQAIRVSVGEEKKEEGKGVECDCQGVNVNGAASCGVVKV